MEADMVSAVHGLSIPGAVVEVKRPGKTARRREYLKRLEKQKRESIAAAIAKEQAERARCRARLISEPWVELVAQHGMRAYKPDTACMCEACVLVGRLWPACHVGGGELIKIANGKTKAFRLSYDCFLQCVEDPRQMMAEREHVLASSTNDAIAEGLTPRSENTWKLGRMVNVCENCDRPCKHRYCRKCMPQMLAECIEGGWTIEQAEAWCRGDEGWLMGEGVDRGTN